MTYDKLNIFNLCIYFKDEISILGYAIDLSQNFVYIQIKNLLYESSQYILDNYFQTITVNSENKYTFYAYFYTTSLIKINDNRFTLIILDSSLVDLYIILFDLYSSTDLLIRYYSIPLKMYDIRILNGIIGFNFIGFLGIGMSTQELHNSNKMREYIFFLSYINGTDSDLISLESNTVITLSDYINNESIENNLFGYTFYGIKLLKLPNINDIGIYYF